MERKIWPIRDDMPAWIFGFCRRIADSNVEPDRGSPEMK